MPGHLLILKGLPASGKSTFALDLIHKDKTYKRVNMDSLRLMFDNGDYDRVDNKLVARMRDTAIATALRKGYNVVSDDTNLSHQAERELRLTAARVGASVSVKFFDTPLHECIARDAKREGPAQVGEQVIRDFHGRYLKHKNFKVENPIELAGFEPYEYQEGLPWAILVDFDGTLADNNGRNPFDWKACINDTPREAVVDLLRIINWYNHFMHNDVGEKTHIIIMSGRDAICMPECLEWLKIYEIRFDEIFLCAEGDTRADYIKKRELFNNHIRGRYNIRFALDDRQQVVDEWRAMGIDCFQVQPSFD